MANAGPPGAGNKRKSQLDQFQKRPKRRKANNPQERAKESTEQVQILQKELNEANNYIAKFNEIIHEELECAMCKEIFIEATTLNCRHTFCKWCVNKWLGLGRGCPTCRSPVTSQVQAIALDNFTKRMVEQHPEEVKQQRERLIKQRKDEQENRQTVSQRRRERRRNLDATVGSPSDENIDGENGGLLRWLFRM